jgi:integrase
VKPSTLRDYRSALQHHFIGTAAEPGWLRDVPLERVTAGVVEEWRARAMAGGLSRRNAAKLVAILHGVFQRARKRYRFPSNPIADVERLAVKYEARLDFYEPEEVWALVRAAKDEQDGGIFLTAAFTGLRRGEALALRWRDVDFDGQAIRVVENLAGGAIGTPKSGRVRSVPMVPEVAQALARLSQRDRFTKPGDFVFVGERGEPLDRSALRRRYIAAQGRANLRSLRLHDLRHTFGSLAARQAESTRELQEWMGHADPKTTARYTHYRSRGGEAARLAGAFRLQADLQAEDFHDEASGFHPDAGEERESQARIGDSAAGGGTGRPA